MARRVKRVAKPDTRINEGRILPEPYRETEPVKVGNTIYYRKCKVKDNRLSPKNL